MAITASGHGGGWVKGVMGIPTADGQTDRPMGTNLRFVLNRLLWKVKTTIIALRTPGCCLTD